MFVLFFALLALGYFQARDRTVSRGRIFLLPIAMVGLSFYGVVSAFGIVLIGLACWALGLAAPVLLGPKLPLARGATYARQTGEFSIPGSWLPLVLMMAIFFMKYAVGVISARQLPIAAEATFVAAVGFCYGLFSGVFLARALAIGRSAERALRVVTPAES